MPVSLENISTGIPMGANLISNGATFRVWAPNATAVFITGDFNSGQPDDTTLLNQIGNGHWAGFVSNVTDRQQYMFYVDGLGSSGPKRDPYARELASPFPGSCIIRDPAFPWHETGYVTPDFSDFVIYQLHVGVFYAPRLPECGTFLDVASKIPYLSDLGVTIIQLLPIQEYSTPFSEGYNNLDFYSPEMQYGVADADLPPYLAAVNTLLAAKGQQPYGPDDLLGEMNQLKAFVDLCHVYGLGVIFDQVYNHAGGGWDPACLYYFDRQVDDPLYFTDVGFVGGLVFDYSKPDVRDFLINNAKFFLEEYRVDGFRYDEVSTIDNLGQPDGWLFCQNLTSTTEYVNPKAINHAEYWQVNPLVVQALPAGAGFNTTLTDGLRNAIRDVIGNASQPNDNPLNMDGLAASMWPGGFGQEWQFVQGPENHDIVYINNSERMTKLSDPSNSRSWYATSRSRVSTGICLTAPGIPMLFMGQEFLEDKQWADDFAYYPGQFIYWDGLDLQKQMSDFLRFTSDLIGLRWQYPALMAQGFAVICTNNQDRVFAFHRWDGYGSDVVVVVHLGNSNVYGYRIGFPWGGTWKEAFNSDVYENWVNPNVCGNGGQITTDNIPYDGQGFSIALALPANGVLVFGR